MSPALRTTLAAALVALLAAATLVVLARPAGAAEAAATAASGATTATAGAAEIEFVEPSRYRDAGLLAADRERTQAALAAHLRRLAEQLPAGQRLRVQVLDIDLAGERHPGASRDVRVLRGGADVPRLHLKWSLDRGGRVVESGEDRLRDLDYLAGLPRAAGSEELPYEKRMLTRWFKERVLAR